MIRAIARLKLRVSNCPCSEASLNSNSILVVCPTCEVTSVPVKLVKESRRPVVYVS